MRVYSHLGTLASALPFTTMYKMAEVRAEQVHHGAGAGASVKYAERSAYVCVVAQPDSDTTESVECVEW